MAPNLSREVACFCGHPKYNVVCCGCWMKIWDRDRWWQINGKGINKKQAAVIHSQDPKPDATAADPVIVDEVDYEIFQ